MDTPPSAQQVRGFTPEGETPPSDIDPPPREGLPGVPAVRRGPETVELESADGVRLKATWLGPDGEVRAAALLVPMLGRSRDTYQDFAGRLVDEGFATLALDVRGHGESAVPAGVPDDPREFTAEHWRDAVQDLEAGAAFLAEQTGDAPLVVVGASIGSTLAVLFAERHRRLELAGLVLLSPGLNYRGVDLVPLAENLGGVPVLAVAGEKDDPSPRAAQALGDLGGSFESSIFAGDAHGTEMLDQALPRDEVIAWLIGRVPTP